MPRELGNRRLERSAKNPPRSFSRGPLFFRGAGVALDIRQKQGVLAGVIVSVRMLLAGRCSASYGRLPALRRTFTTSSGFAPARASSRPLRTVLIAMPVARATAATPPHPSAPASVPAQSRRARSSIIAFNRRHFCRITFSAPVPTSTVDHARVILSIPCSPFGVDSIDSAIPRA